MHILQINNILCVFKIFARQVLSWVYYLASGEVTDSWRPINIRDRESNLPSFGNLRQPRDHLRPSSAQSPSQGKRTVSTGTGTMFRAVFRFSVTGARSLAKPRLSNSGRAITCHRNIYRHHVERNFRLLPRITLASHLSCSTTCVREANMRVTLTCFLPLVFRLALN